MPNKDVGKNASAAVANDLMVGVTPVGRPADKMGKSVGVKTSAKVSWKGVEVIGAPPPSPPEELLGSVTSGGVEGAVRTSARVIKKMKLDSTPAPDTPTQLKKESVRDGDKPDDPSKILTDKQTKITKCRTPKAPWSSTEKTLFFEALNEYGKDFDSITAYISNKMKRKGVPDSSTKGKHQVSTFYYRTWQKVSKYIKFPENVKKVVQELYALINYGEIRKRLEGSISSSKVGGRLGELVRRGVVTVRWRGRNLRIRTPVCRALRTLNQLHEWEEQLRLPVRVVVQLCARDSEAWRIVQGVSHNPRVLVPAPPSLRLYALLHFLSKRWTLPPSKDSIRDLHEKNSLSCYNLLDCQIASLLNPSMQTSLKLDALEQNGIAERGCDVSSTKNSDLNSCSKVDEAMDERNISSVSNGIHNDVQTDDVSKTAKPSIDSIEDTSIRVVSQQHEVNSGQRSKLSLHVGPRPGITVSMPVISVGEHLTSQRICFDSYQERLRSNTLFSGLQNGTGFKGGGRFKNQKRNRKDSGDVENKKGKSDTDVCDKNDVFDIDETANDGMDIVMDMKSIDDDEKDKDFFSEQEEELECEGDGKPKEQTDDVTKVLTKNKPNEKSKKENQKTITDSPEDNKTPAVVSSGSANGGKTWNKDVLLQQIKRGWSVTDAGDLSIGDLYLMFGSESKVELEYWWCEASAPSTSIVEATSVEIPCTPDTLHSHADTGECYTKDVEALLLSPSHASQDSNDIEKDIVSPDTKRSQQPEDVMASNGFPLVSKIIPASVAMVQPDPKSPEQRETTHLIVPNRDRVVSISSRLKKLLSLARLYDAKGTKTGCSCGHFCATSRVKFRNSQSLRDDSSVRPTVEYPWQRGIGLSNTQEIIHFRTPLPKIAVRPAPVRLAPDLGLDKLPPWTKRGGRPRHSTVPPQRFTILPRPNPTLPITRPNTNNNTSSGSQPTGVKVLPRLKPKPCVVTVRPSITIERSTPLPSPSPSSNSSAADTKPDISHLDTIKSSNSNSSTPTKRADNLFIVVQKPEGSSNKWSPGSVKQELADETPNLANLLDISLPSNICDDNSIGIAFKTGKNHAEDKHDNFTGLLPAESMSMSPSRLLKENDDQWLDSEVHNFSLSSFLGHLEGSAASSTASKLGKPDDDSNMVDTPLHCLMNDSIDYMAKFEDLAKRVSAEATK